MAMLAEQRRRQKYSTDPRGLGWSSDESKFGQKLMEKYGWTKGQGLGANEDGMTEHIKIQAKSDSRGVGCTKKHEDNWIAHQDDFNSLLASLNSQNLPAAEEGSTDMVQVLSLEQKSKKSKRVHYGKFTRGKDLSRAGIEDMDCIFGRRKSKSTPATPQDVSAANSDNEDSSNEGKEVESAEHGVTTISTGMSVQAYFAKKMAELQKARAAVNGEVISQDTCESRPESREETSVTGSEGVHGKDGMELTMSGSCHTESTQEIRKRKKKSRKRKNQEGEDSGKGSSDESGSVEAADTHQKKSKKRKVAEEKCSSTSDADLKAGVDDEIKETSDIKSNVISDSEQCKKKKKKKSKKKNNEERSLINGVETEAVENNVEESIELAQDCESEQPRIKKKKSKKDKQRRTLEENNTVIENLGVSSDSSHKKQVESVNVRMHVPDCSDPNVKYDHGVKTPNELVEVGFKGSNIGSIKGYGEGTKIRDKKVKKSKKKSKH